MHNPKLAHILVFHANDASTLYPSSSQPFPTASMHSKRTDNTFDVISTSSAEFEDLTSSDDLSDYDANRR